jgi:hypothetical protein
MRHNDGLFKLHMDEFHVASIDLIEAETETRRS